jgi:hypothetical protein
MQPWRFAEKGGSNRQAKNEKDHLAFPEGPFMETGKAMISATFFDGGREGAALRKKRCG